MYERELETARFQSLSVELSEVKWINVYLALPTFTFSEEYLSSLKQTSVNLKNLQAWGSFGNLHQLYRS